MTPVSPGETAFLTSVSPNECAVLSHRSTYTGALGNEDPSASGRGVLDRRAGPTFLVRPGVSRLGCSEVGLFDPLYADETARVAGTADSLGRLYRAGQVAMPESRGAHYWPLMATS